VRSQPTQARPKQPRERPGPATDDQKWWLTLRAEAEQHRDQAAAAGNDTADLDELITELDDQITAAGIRGRAAPARPARRHRSTRRRQDAPDLPKRKIDPRTVGKTCTAPDGTTFRPSLFVTLTCPSYGRVDGGGVPADPVTYEYDRAARDVLHFAALFDRFIQNLRRYLGYDAQYFRRRRTRNGSPRTSTSPCAAPSPGPRSAASWPPPTTRSGGHPPAPSDTAATSCPCGTSTRRTTSTRRPGKS
jgi:hypothetical protein